MIAADTKKNVSAANVMIREDGALQIIDFGVSVILETKQEKRSTFIGTPQYMPVEMFTPLRVRELSYSTEVGVRHQQSAIQSLIH